MIKKTIEYIKIPKKSFYIGLAIVVIILLGLMLRPQIHQVEVASVKRGEFQSVVVDEGVTQFRDKHILSSPADGIIPSHNLRAGDPVKKGQVLLNFLWNVNFKLKSPVDGYILKVYEKDRRRVAPGTPLLEVGDPNSTEIVADLLSEEVIDIKIGQKALITKWGGEPPLEAVVRKIEKAAKETVSALGVKEQRVNVFFDITTDKKVWANLGDSFRVEVTVITEKLTEVSLLPIGAIFNSEDKPAVFTYDPKTKKIKLTSIEIGDRNQQVAHLISEIPEGTLVVLYPSKTLSDGDRVKTQ